MSRRAFARVSILATQFQTSHTLLSTQMSESKTAHGGKPLTVTVVGAAGGIGQPLSLLLKNSDLISNLHLYDVVPVLPGVAADLSHINSPAKVTAFAADKLREALTGSDIVVVPAGVPRKPGMTRDDLFNVNAGIVAGIAKAVAEVAPKACLLIISNPVNSTVPIAAEVMKKYGTYDPNRLFGVTTLDAVRAATFVAENQKTDVRKTSVPVIGGHAGITIIPLLSNVPGAKFSTTDRDALTKRIMFGGDEVVQAKAGAGSATLSMAQAGAAFTFSVARALLGEKGIVECSYVQSPLGMTTFFSSPVELGPNGIAKVLPLPKLNEFEQEKLKAALPELKASIDSANKFVASWVPK